LKVGDYTVFTMGDSLKGSKITQFLVEITQVECWRLHSFLLWIIKGFEITQFVVEIT
jgi:hypothetical protein